MRMLAPGRSAVQCIQREASVLTVWPCSPALAAVCGAALANAAICIGLHVRSVFIVSGFYACLHMMPPCAVLCLSHVRRLLEWRRGFGGINGGCRLGAACSARCMRLHAGLGTAGRLAGASSSPAVRQSRGCTQEWRTLPFY